MAKKNRKQVERRLAAQKLRKRQKSQRQFSVPTETRAIEDAEEYLAAGDWESAREILEEENSRRPGRSRVLYLLLDVYYGLKLYSEYCDTCRELLSLDPDNPSLLATYAAGLLASVRPAWALQVFERLVARWPDDPFAEGAREEIVSLKSALGEVLAGWPFPEKDRFEIAALNEELQSYLPKNPQKAIATAKSILNRWPNFVAARNNLAEAYFQSGDFDLAIETSQHVLEVEPENLFALANHSRHAFLAGHFDESQLFSVQLRAKTPSHLDGFCKQAEVFALEGDYTAVLEVVRRAEGAFDFGEHDPNHVAMLCHLAGVAASRTGERRRAERYWKRALKSFPKFDLAEENLADAKLSVGHRQGAWPFHVTHWIPSPAMRRFVEEVDRMSRGKRGDIPESRRRELSRKFPYAVALLPHLLDRGNGFAREFALHVAAMLDLPETRDALRTFCLGQSGTDELRMESLSLLKEAGAIAEGSVRMWLNGEWHDIEAFQTEITNEPNTSYNRSDEANDLAIKAAEALHREDAATAERLLRKAIAIDGEQPDLLNNLAMAIQLRGDREESLRIARDIHHRWPDYFFGCIAIANLMVDEGDFARARELLGPLSKRRQLHASEFCAMCMAYIHLEMVQGNRNDAEKWLDRWEEIAPDHPQLPEFRMRILGTGALRALRSFLPRGKRRRR